MHKKYCLTLAFVLFVFLTATANAFPLNSLRPGGVTILSVAPSQYPKPRVTYESSSVAIVKGQQNWLAIVGINLQAKIGTHHVVITDHKGRTRKQSFHIKKHQYKTQHLTIKNKNKVNPNKASTKRIEKEFFLKRTLKNTFSRAPAKLNFIRPVKGRDSGRFGLRRVLNKQSRNPHSGMDVAASTGTKVRATESGRVIFTGDLFFTGKVVYVDHGNGVISLYAHLSKINVQKDQYVKRGQIIGLVGKTGRATGAHLHWSVYLNGNAVDPALFTP